MAFVLDDRVRETSTAPGTGSFTMNGAVQGAQTFSAALTSNGDTTWYEADNGTAWETGLLTRTSATVYARTTIFRSTNGNAAVNFASGAVSVSCDLPAGKAKVLERLLWSSAAITPPTNDGTALGTSSLMFSDLFLASGGVINFNNGDVTVAHSTDALAFAGAANGYTFDQPLTFTSALGAVRSKIVTFSRAMNAANGSVAYTGVGFRPSALIMLGSIVSTPTLVSGFFDSSGAGVSSTVYGAGLAVTNNGFQAYIVDGTAANSQTAALSSYDSDGFTLAWTKAGSPTGTLALLALCLR